MSLFCSDEHCSFLSFLTFTKHSHFPIHSYTHSYFQFFKIILIFTVVTAFGGEFTPLSAIIIFTHPFLIPFIKTTHSPLQIHIFYTKQSLRFHTILNPMESVHSMPSYPSSPYRTCQENSDQTNTVQCLKPCMNTLVCNTNLSILCNCAMIDSDFDC